MRKNPDENRVVSLDDEVHPDAPEPQIVIICRSHRRRSHVAPAGPSGRPQLWHDGGNGEALCSSQRFLYRIEDDLSREEVLAKAAPSSSTDIRGRPVQAHPEDPYRSSVTRPVMKDGAWHEEPC